MEVGGYAVERCGGVSRMTAGASSAASFAANLAAFEALPRSVAPLASADAKLVRLFLDAQETSHGLALKEIQAGRKTSHWIWWEWPAYTPVRSTSRPEFDLKSCSSCRAWLSHPLLGARWAEMTTAAIEHLENRVEPTRLFGSGTDASKFHENCTLVSLCAPHDEQRDLAARALSALRKLPHPTVLRSVQAERMTTAADETTATRVLVIGPGCGLTANEQRAAGLAGCTVHNPTLPEPPAASLSSL